MAFSDLVKQRYSVRKYDSRPIEAEKLDAILEAGRLAPTAVNYQPQRILVLRSAQAMEKLRGCTRCHFGAPMAMLICCNTEECWKRTRYDGRSCGEIDAAIVTTHMMLAAADLGLGSTWVMYFDPDAVRREFHIPDHIDPVALLVMGYPAPDAAPLHLHSEYRPQEDVVLYDSFA